ncbi:MAG: agmatine deiminase family protein [Candidatus Kapabacteria bacterium]|nr:agmatine deiminase family protein [Candidatus Kapabacteria bacterium]
MAQTSGIINPQTSEQRSRALAVEQLQAMSKQEITALVAQSKHRNPKIIPFYDKIRQHIQSGGSLTKNQPSLQSPTRLTMPPSFSVPGEFEESQAALIVWSSLPFNSNGEIITSFTKDFGYEYNPDTEELTTYRIAGYVLDSASEFSDITATLANAIQQEVPVWIIVYNAWDTNTVKRSMERRGTPLTNYRFFVTGGGNDWWARDFGPIGFYYGDKDSVGFLDVQYYSFRPADDSIPQLMGKELGYKTWTTSLENEGGNFMTDGWGNSYTSTAVIENNNDTEGVGRIETVNGVSQIRVMPKQRWTQTRTQDTMQNVYGASRMTILRRLLCDGGTGHIDMYLKLFDDETLIASEYGAPFNKSSFNDYSISRTNITTLNGLKTTHNRSMRILRMPIPTMDNGRYDSTTCMSFGSDPRGFLNGLTINKTFLFPSYSNDVSGNKKQTQEAIELYKKFLPGYKIVPIDSRLLTPMGGALHCITMQIPAENPLRFRHAAWRDNVATMASYPVRAVITNHSGIKQALMKWRKKGDQTWTTVELSKDTSSLYTASIPGDLGATNQSIEYYLEAEANNGKKQMYPITSPEGFFTFTFGSLVSVAEENIVHAELQTPYPNPSSSSMMIPFTLLDNANIQLTLIDLNGVTVQSYPAESLVYGSYLRNIFLDTLASGVYHLRMTANGVMVGTRMVVKH